MNYSFKSDHEFHNEYESHSSNTNGEEDNLNESRELKRMRLWTDSVDGSTENNKQQNIQIYTDRRA